MSKRLSIFEELNKLTPLQRFNRSSKLTSVDKLILKSKIKGLAETSKGMSPSNFMKCRVSYCIRMHLLAYAFLRRKPYRSIERNCHDTIYPSRDIFEIVKSSTFFAVEEVAIKEWLSEE